jgi:hypothetical protein
MKQINEIRRMQQLAGLIKESQLNEGEDLLSLIKDYADYDYTVDQGYGEDVVSNAQTEMERIKNEIIGQKGQQYFELVKDYAELFTYESEYAGPDDMEKLTADKEETAQKLGFTVDQLG